MILDCIAVGDKLYVFLLACCLFFEHESTQNPKYSLTVNCNCDWVCFILVYRLEKVFLLLVSKSKFNTRFCCEKGQLGFFFTRFMYFRAFCFIYYTAYKNASISSNILSDCCFNKHPKFRRYKAVNNLEAPRYDKYLACPSKCSKKHV